LFADFPPPSITGNLSIKNFSHSCVLFT
jgi:hypothetical protein